MNSTAPESQGAEILQKFAFEDFLQKSVVSASKDGVLGALVLMRITGSSGQLLPQQDLQRASLLLTQLGRQADAMARLGQGTLGLILCRLVNRSDVHVMLGRIEDFFHQSKFSWTIATGVGVFPMCGTSGEQAWGAARRDLEGALSSESWEHEIPRETIRVLQAS